MTTGNLRFGQIDIIDVNMLIEFDVWMSVEQLNQVYVIVGRNTNAPHFHATPTGPEANSTSKTLKELFREH